MKKINLGYKECLSVRKTTAKSWLKQLSFGKISKKARVLLKVFFVNVVSFRFFKFFPSITFRN